MIHNNDFDPMSESTFKPDVVSKEKYNEIKENGIIMKAFHEKFASIVAKYEIIFVDGIGAENDWTDEDAQLYESYKKESKNLPSEWNINLYAINL